MGLITKLVLLAIFAFVVMAMGVRTHAAPAKSAVAEEVVVKGKKPAAKKAAPKKKDDGKIKPLDPNRKVPTLKKKYRKD